MRLEWKTVLAGILTFLIIIAVLVMKQQCSVVQEIRIGVYKGEAALLPIFAKDLGYFKESGLNVKLSFFPSGRDAFKAMLDGKVDLATSTDMVVVANSHQAKPFQVITGIAEGDINGFIGNITHGIQKPMDLVGKRIATARGTAAEYFLGIWLKSNGMQWNDIQLIDIPPAKIHLAFSEYQVDGVFIWEPNLFKLEKKLGRNAVRFSLPPGYPFYFVLSASQKILASQELAIKPLLSALKAAEQWMNLHPAEFRQWTKKTFQLDDDYFEYTMFRHKIKISIPEALETSMKKIDEWLIENRKFQARDHYDYSSLIYMP